MQSQFYLTTFIPNSRIQTAQNKNSIRLGKDPILITSFHELRLNRGADRPRTSVFAN